MPVKPRFIEGKWRVVDPDGSICKNRSGTPVDGDGHDTREAAYEQCKAINASLKKQSKA